MRVSFRQIQAFILVAEVRSFTRAADTLHVTQAGLSSMVNELETRLGVRLFERTNRSVELTRAGLQFLPYARQSVESLSKGALELAALRRRQEGGIRVGVSPLIASTALPRVVREFTLSTGRACEVVDAELEVLHDMVEAGSLDATYGTYQQRNSRLRSEPIFGMALRLVAPADKVARCPRIESGTDWEKLGDDVLWVLPDSNVIQNAIDRYLLELGAQGLQRQEVFHIATIMSFIASGMGMGFVPAFVLNLKGFETIAEIALPQAPPVIDFYCTHDATNQASSSIQAFSRILASQCGAP